MAKYIKNKKIDVSESNKVPKLKGIGKAAWNFLSAIYNSGWNLFFADKDNNFFR